MNILRRAFSLSLASPPHPFSYGLPPNRDTSPLRSTSQTPQGMSRNHRGSPSDTDTELSDQEWEMRTGRAIYIMRQTFPHFFTTGLVSSLPPIQPSTKPASSSTVSNSSNSRSHDQESIYAPNIRLSYTPPLALPKPLQTLQIEGLPLYYASAVFVRHTLNALYMNMSVQLKRITVNSSGSGSRSARSSSTVGDGERDYEDAKHRPSTRHRREKSVFIAVTVTGKSRVSGGLGIWDVASTYQFEPTTALITHHTVNSIHPAPHDAVYEALRGVLFGRQQLPFEGGLGVGLGRSANVGVPVDALARVACDDEPKRNRLVVDRVGDGRDVNKKV